VDAQRPVQSFTVPKPRLELVKNLTPFAHFQCQKMGPGRRFFDTLVVKGSFRLAADVVPVAEEQAPIVFADRYFGPDAARSSVTLAGDVLLAKPGTDVLVTGAARAPGGKHATEWDCAVVVRGKTGTLLRHALRVTGPRSWIFRALRGWTLTDPLPAASVPIRYELAYGGAYMDPRSDPARPKWIVHGPNPCGTGFFDEAALDRGRPVPGPQWQLHGQPVTAMNREVQLAGLGPVARHWSSRSRYAGTCDAEWERQAAEDIAAGLPPDYPGDLDLRFFQCAHPALCTKEPLAGDEHIGLSGLTGDASDTVFRLPGITLPARVLSGSGDWHDRRMTLDTVHVDLDARAVHLTHRLTLDPEHDMRAAVIDIDGDLHG